MGWCSGTYSFDIVCDALFSEKSQIEILKQIIIELEGMDWDCQMDSSYYDHPLVQQAFKELHQDWFEEE